MAIGKSIVNIIDCCFINCRTLAYGIISFVIIFCTSLPIAQGSNIAIWLTIDGVISPATHDYLKRSFGKAIKKNARVIIIQIDTPGGLDASMRDIVRDILASPVPVMSFVSPSGARATSAGTYILQASHIAAMSPATNLGAATPVRFTGFPGGDTINKDSENGEDEGRMLRDPISSKIINDAVAYIRGLAQMRGRNIDWVEQMVREGVSLTAEEALSENVIDLMATSIPDLLASTDGLTVNVLGQEQTLSTANITVQRLEQDWRTRLLTIITDPNVAYILMLLGIYALIFEFSNPGTFFSGVVGAVCLLLALFAFQVLPINYAGLALIMLGIIFMLGEVFAPSFGMLVIGGVIAFVIGSVMLLDTGVPGYGISIPLILMLALFSAVFFILILGLVVKARKRPVVSGKEQLLGGIGEALEDFDGDGWIRIHGERWEAHSSEPLKQGQKVCVVAENGLILVVKPYSNLLKQTKES